MSQKIEAVFIMEALGRPPEHLKETLGNMIDKIDKEKDVSLKDSKIAEPKNVKDEKNVFSSFAEVEFETTLEKLLKLTFSYMPANIEIISPENLKLTNSNMNDFFNQLTQKLHQYDEVAKTMMMQRKQLAKQIKEGKIKIEKVDDTNKNSKSEDKNNK